MKGRENVAPGVAATTFGEAVRPTTTAPDADVVAVRSVGRSLARLLAATELAASSKHRTDGTAFGEVFPRKTLGKGFVRRDLSVPAQIRSWQFQLSA
jgi:hypothetical protein